MTVPAFAEPKTIGSLLGWARQVLDAAGVTNPAQEAQWLLEHALGMRSHQLVSAPEQPVSLNAWTRAESLVGRRAAREPLQYLLGTQEFCGLEFDVSPTVLIPRAETELLVQEVVRRGGLDRGSVVVDVGTGSGCVAVTLATIFSETRLLAIDRSLEALTVAKSNAAKHAVGDKIEWCEGDLLAPLREKELSGGVAIIVSNPPYIAEMDWAQLQPEVRLFEPRMALIGGQTGTEFHQRLLQEAREFLAPGGMLLMEVGQGQAPAVRRMAEQVGGYAALRVIEDDAGIERVVIAQQIG